MSLIQPCNTCNPLKYARNVLGMARILLIIAAVIAAFLLIGPLLGLAFSLIKWALIIGAVAFGVLLLKRVFNN